MPDKLKALAICGPTAVGKSALSIEIATALAGEVVNVDSVQVYRELDVGSAKLSLSERGGVPHHVIDVFSPDMAGNVGEFRDIAYAKIRDIIDRKRLPILVGGSGLYLTALLHGLADLPRTTEDVRALVAAMPAAVQYEELCKIDPIAAQRINPNDSQRVSRALEIFHLTGRPPTEIFAQHAFLSVDIAALVIVPCRGRGDLYARINTRSQRMIEDGLIEEAEGLLRRYGRIPIMETLGYRQACDFLQGNLSKEDLIEEISKHTRQFAKRQMTYWRNEPAKRGWFVRPLDGEEDAVEVAGFETLSPQAQKKSKGFRAFDWDTPTLITKIESRLREPLSRTEVWFVAAK